MKFSAVNVDVNSVSCDLRPHKFKEFFVRGHQIWVPQLKCVIIARCTLIPEVAPLSTYAVARLMSDSSDFLSSWLLSLFYGPQNAVNYFPVGVCADSAGEFTTIPESAGRKTTTDIPTPSTLVLIVPRSLAPTSRTNVTRPLTTTIQLISHYTAVTLLMVKIVNCKSMN